MFIAHLENGQVVVPDVKLEGPLPLRGIYEFHALRGYGAIVAVRSKVNGSWLGWIPADEADPSIPADGHAARTLLAKVNANT